MTEFGQPRNEPWAASGTEQAPGPDRAHRTAGPTGHPPAPAPPRGESRTDRTPAPAPAGHASAVHAPTRSLPGGSGPAGVDPFGAGDRCLVYRGVLPEVCGTDPNLMTFTGDAGGRCEVFAWDAAAGRARQVTDRPQGTLHGSIDQDAYVWWFDEDTHGVGTWRFQPFHGGRDRPGLLDVPAGTPRGLAVSDDATVAMGLGHGHTTSVHMGARGQAGQEVTRVDGYATVSGLTPTGDLLAISGPAGSSRAVTILRADGVPRAVLSGEHGRLWSLGFAPTGERDELLLIREDDDRYLLASWRPGTGIRTYTWCAFDTEISARWYPEGREVLIRQDRHSRSTLYRATLDDFCLTQLTTRPGSLLDAAPRAGGDLHELWTDIAHPPRLLSSAGTALPSLGTFPGQVPGDHREVWTPGPDGPVHTLLSLPGSRAAGTGHDDGDRPGTGPHGKGAESDGRRTPPPVVFLVHGGPTDHDRDSYDGVVHYLLASGFAVARVNYRGSTSYGPRWRRAYGAGVGLTQVEDLVAVRADLIERGLVDANAVGLWGSCWGGYLALLALGTRPELWQAGVAIKPIADSVAAHRTTTPALRAETERLYGGTPDEVPDAYARSSPIRFADRVRAPLLVVAAAQDAACPPEQVRSYLAALRTADVPHESVWLDTRHDGHEGDDRMAILRRGTAFLDHGLRPRTRAPRTSTADRPADSGRDRPTAPAGSGRAKRR